MKEFLKAAADWADERAADVKFMRDEYDGWCAIISFSDRHGSFSAIVKEVSRIKGDDVDSYSKRVASVMNREAARARQRRIASIVGRTAAKAA